jgi:hypothetical protein
VERHQPELVRAAMMLFLVGPLVLVVWYFSGNGSARPLAGSLWAQYESQVQTTVQNAGGSIGEKGCEMVGNVSAALICPVVGVAPHTLVTAFSVAGWKLEPSDSTTLSTEGARLSIHSAKDRSSVTVSIALRKK